MLSLLLKSDIFNSFVVMFNAASHAQDIVFFGAMLSFHVHFLTSHRRKHVTTIAFICYALGKFLSTLRNVKIVSNKFSYICFVLEFIGVILIICLCVHHFICDFRLYNKYPTNESEKQVGIYIYLLTLNQIIRAVFYLTANDADRAVGTNAAEFIITNTITVILLSALHSRKIKQDAMTTKVNSHIETVYMCYVYMIKCCTSSVALSMVYLDIKHMNL